VHFGRRGLQCGANETLDVLLDGRVRIIQRRDGYRVNQDSLRLCRFVRPMPGAAGIDLGAGCGIVAIVLSLEKKIKHMVALELQETLADLARRNTVLNGLGGHADASGRAIDGISDHAEVHHTTDNGSGGHREAGVAACTGPHDRVEIIRGDILKVEKLFAPHSFDLAVSNPPYREAGRGRTGPSTERTIARHEQACSLSELLRAAAYILKPQGIFAFCQLRERWQEIAETLAAHDFIVSRREVVGAVVLVEAGKTP